MKVDVRKYLGKAFQDGGRGPDSFDCWGLVLAVYEDSGIRLPDYGVGAYESERISQTIGVESSSWLSVETENAQPSDLYVFALDPRNQDFVTHVGLVTTQRMFLHCLDGHGVIQSKVFDRFWAPKYRGTFRWVV